ncbi:MAG: chorismate-binding protein [Acidaminococcus intestini]|uniref:Anthranilate synthase component 1 n=1 Tax=Acidaminococcus intestini TaxID=187327 RepID=A0A943EFL8_9FIRM|nr:chorismate-binding protein [Acidaminococcus intestini]
MQQGGTAGLSPVLVRGQVFLFYQDLLGGYLAFVNQIPAVFYVKEEIIVKETSLTEARCLAESGGAVPIVRQLLADMVTPLGLMSLIRKDHDRYFLLESLEGIDARGRYSFIGYDPLLRLSAKDFAVTVETRKGTQKSGKGPLDLIRNYLKEYQNPKVPGLPPFTGGFVGYFSYDFIQYCEPSLRFDPKKATDFPDFDLMFFDKVIVFDAFKQTLFLIANAKADAIDETYKKAIRDLDVMETLVKTPVQAPQEEPAHLGPIASNQTRETYNENIARIKHFIREGDIFQAVYSQCFSASYDKDLFSFYRVLRRTNPSQYMMLMKLGDTEIAGSSPETLIRLEGRTITSMPIAGTWRRGRTEEEEKRLEEDLTQDAKELAEHNMLVDLARNDVGKVSEFGSVKVHDLHHVKRFSHVMHLTSRVTGQLKKGLDAIDTLCAALPAGTLSGAPKIRACEILDGLEPQRRGPYGGGIGYLDLSGNMDICITIRTAVKRGDTVYFQSGGGIVADSVTENEFQETLNKSGAVKDALMKTAEAE